MIYGFAINAPIVPIRRVATMVHWSLDLGYYINEKEA